MENNNSFVVYSLYDGSEVVYIGVTSDPDMRVREHEFNGLKFTRMEIGSRKLPRDQAQQKELQLLGSIKKKRGGNEPKYNQAS